MERSGEGFDARVEGPDVRLVLGLHEHAPEDTHVRRIGFEIRVERDARGDISEITAEGMGWGHGIGMCQVGAMGRARAGQNYRQILQAYYEGTRLTRLY